MGTKSFVSAGAFVCLVAACQGETYHPPSLGDCTAASGDQPCIGALIGEFPSASSGSGSGGVTDGGDGGDGGVPAMYVDPGPCKVGGNILYVNGANGPVTVNMGTDVVMDIKNWQVDVQINPLAADAGGDGGGASHEVVFSSDRPNTPPLTVGDYPDAQGTPYPGHPGLIISGYSVPCNTTYQYMDFRITDINIGDVDSGYPLNDVTMVFYHTCNSDYIRWGCFHYAM